MILTPTGLNLTNSDYPPYVWNCNRDQTEPQYYAPLKGFGYLQFYVDFGASQPLTQEITAVSLCGDSLEEQIFTANYVVSKTPEGNWYGVWKYFNEPDGNFRNFVIHFKATVVDPVLGLVERSWYSQAMQIEICDPLMKIKACMPEREDETAFDINGLYYGLPDEADYYGVVNVRYFHIGYVRTARVRERANTITFKQSLTRSFNSELVREYLLETELVPKWYKDELLAIFARGIIEVDGTQWLVKDIEFEPINDDDFTWKPYANLHKTQRLYFGCDESTCPECCSPIVIAANVITTVCDCEPEVISADAEVVVEEGIFSEEFDPVFA